MENNSYDLICILGPTASGKTSLAVSLASSLGGEIISADSRQVYRGMNIGTGKDLHEYGSVPYHLIDILDAGDIYGVGQFQLDFNRVYHEIKSRGKTPVLCGGTGLYIQAVLQNFAHTYIPRNDALRKVIEPKTSAELKSIFYAHPESHTFEADTSTHKRLVRAIEIATWLKNNEIQSEMQRAPNTLIFGIDPDWQLRRDRISERLKQRFDAGLIAEVRDLLDRGVPSDMLIFYGLEYKIITQHLLGHFNLQECFQRLEIAIHQFAKRQMTYFRKMEKDGLKIHWMKESSLEERLAFIKKYL